jgi:Pyrimidine dimer DNA glycosylase
VRIWDVDPAQLCDRHLLGEHRELHAIWAVLTGGKRGYARHPETLRWRGRLAALYARHDAQVAELARRGFRHASPLDRELATGAVRQTELVDPVDEQRARLLARGCGCPRAVTAPASTRGRDRSQPPTRAPGPP